MPVVLDDRFRFADDVAIDFHDILVHIVKDGDAHGLFDVSIQFRSRRDAKAFAEMGEQSPLDWLEEHGYVTEMYEVARRNVTRALIGDFCHFVLEALRASEKGKIPVAWTLFRKAFKDNLFYLEWMLADSQEFLDRFHHQGPDSLDVSNRQTLPEEKIKNIISAAVEATLHPGWANSEFLYALRYSKAHPEGLESSWNKAAHLITRVKHYATESRNFNYIFSGYEEIYTGWERIYYYIPFLLYHAVLVADELCYRFTGADWSLNLVSDYRRDSGFYLWSRDIGFPRTDGVCIHPWEIIGDLPGIPCQNCGSIFLPHVRQLKRLYEAAHVRCRVCRADIDLMALHYAIAGVEQPSESTGDEDDVSATE